METKRYDLLIGSMGKEFSKYKELIKENGILSYDSPSFKSEENIDNYVCIINDCAIVLTNEEPTSPNINLDFQIYHPDSLNKIKETAKIVGNKLERKLRGPFNNDKPLFFLK